MGALGSIPYRLTFDDLCMCILWSTHLTTADYRYYITAVSRSVCVPVSVRQSRSAMATSLFDQAAPAAGYGAVSEDTTPLHVNARMERGSLSEPLGPEDRSVLSFHHISYSLPKRKFGITSVGRKIILNDLRYIGYGIYYRPQCIIRHSIISTAERISSSLVRICSTDNSKTDYSKTRRIRFFLPWRKG